MSLYNIDEVVCKENNGELPLYEWNKNSEITLIEAIEKELKTRIKYSSILSIESFEEGLKCVIKHNGDEIEIFIKEVKDSCIYFKALYPANPHNLEDYDDSGDYIFDKFYNEGMTLFRPGIVSINQTKLKLVYNLTLDPWNFDPWKLSSWENKDIYPKESINIVDVLAEANYKIDGALDYFDKTREKYNLYL